MKSKIYYSDEFTIITFYIKKVLSNDTRTFTQITRKIYIVNNLKANMLINSNILTPKRIIIDFDTQLIIINSYRSITIPINSRARSNSIKRTIKTSSRIVLSPHFVTPISITYVGELSPDRNLLFKPQCSLSLDHANGVYAHIVNAFFKQIHIRNNINLSITIPRKIRLRILEEYK